MQGLGQQADAFVLSRRSGPVFRVVVVYDELPSAHRALATCEQLLRDSGTDYELKPSLWRLDVLQIPRLRDQAARETGSADMIVVALKGRGHLSVALRSWVAAWPPRNEDAPGALVVLLESDATTESEKVDTLEFLRAAAAAENLVFFGQAQASPLVDSSDQLGGLSHRAVATSSILQEIMRLPSSVPRWGINE